MFRPSWELDVYSLRGWIADFERLMVIALIPVIKYETVFLCTDLTELMLLC